MARATRVIDVGVIDFACKQISLEDLIRCSFSLNKTDYFVFNFILNSNSHVTVSVIAAKLNLDRTTVQKSVKVLMNKSLIVRLRQNKLRGGYAFSYAVDELPKIKLRMKKIVRNWYGSVKSEIDTL